MKDRVVSVVGAGQCGQDVGHMAESLGRLLAEAGCRIVCGGLGGVMLHACKGAKSAGGATIGILPGVDRSEANEFVDIPVVTGLGQVRNYLVVSNGDVVIAVEGGNGTLSEISLALKAGKRVVAIGKWSKIPGVIPADGPEQAVELVSEYLTKG